MSLRSTTSWVRCGLSVAVLVGSAAGRGAIAAAMRQPAIESTPAAAPATEPALSPEEQAAHAAMAEHFAEWAKQVLNQPNITPALMRHSAALLAAAVRENPGEPRFYRLLVEARLQLGTPADLAAARDALKQYLALLAESRQTDVYAQVQLMDLFVTEREDAGKQIDYLRQVIGADGLPAEVRSHAAIRLARVYLDRGQEKEAAGAIDEAIGLNPLNSAALQTKYELIRNDPSVPAVKRLSVMLSMLRANPAQPDVMAGVARELAGQGLVDQAMSMYSLSFDVSRALGLGRSLPDFTDFTAALCMAGQPRDAASAAQQIIDADPGSGDAAFVRLLSERQLGDKARIDAAMQAASDAVLRRMAEVHEQLNKPADAAAAGGAAAPDAAAMGSPSPSPDATGAAGTGAAGTGAAGTGAAGTAAPAPTTQPLEAVADYVMADVQKLKDRGDARLYSSYVSAVARLAWYQVYFAQNPAGAARLIEALKSLLPEGDVAIVRLEGWSLMAQDKAAAANRLSAVADRDPLSKLGLIRLDLVDPATASNAMIELSKLTSENSSGVTGAILVQELRDHGGKFVPSAAASDLRTEYEKFPKELLNILTNPEKFYRLTAEPLMVQHSYGEPMLVRVRIQNISDYDLTLGADGIIHRDLWFDVKLSGLLQQNLPAVAYDRMGQELVLKAKTGVASQVVRVDEGQMLLRMQSYPAMAMPMLFSVFTNPTRNATGVGPGPGGQRAQFNHQMERAAAPVNQQTVPQFLNYLMSGKPAERIQVAELMAAHIRLLAAQAQQLQQQANESGDAAGAAAAAVGAASGAGGAAAAPGAANPAKAADQLMQAAGQFREMLLRAGDVREGSPIVHGWLQYLDSILSEPEGRERRTNAMLGSDTWEERLLGLRLLALMPPEQQKQIAAKLAESDPEPVVRQFAASAVEIADVMAAQAATQPALDPTAPAPAPNVPGMTLTPSPPGQTPGQTPTPSPSPSPDR